MQSFNFYTVEVRGFNTKEDVSTELFKELILLLTSKYELHELNEWGESNEGWFWVDLEENMKEFSKDYPGLEFKVEAEYEDIEDHPEIFWFHKGQMKYLPGKIVFPNYEEVEYE